MTVSRGKTRNTKIDKAIGQRIRAFRNALNMTQVTLADEMGVSWQQVQKYENGSNAVAFTRIGELCKALEITANELFGMT